MFRRLADRVTSAVASVAGSSESSDPVSRLTSMGFSSADARHALAINGDNVEQAAEWLLANRGSHTQPMEDDLQKAISASLEDAARVPQRSAASRRAGQAALERFEEEKTPKPAANGVTTAKTALQSHPNVKVPKRLSQLDKEDVILRCAQRVAPNALAVDTLLKSLRQLQKDPTNQKFRTIDMTTPGFQRTLKDVPGAIDFLKAAPGFHESYSNRNLLELSFVDPATLYLGISALEQIQQNSNEYKENKQQIIFEKEIQQILTLADQDMEEAIKRSQFISKLPSEPTIGGGLITVELGSSSKIQRKFDADDCLQDVLNWLGANGSAIPKKLEANEWHLVDRNHANSTAYNLQELKGRTLQYIGCWPSGRLAILPIPPAGSDRTPTSSRGLGAAPLDAL